MPGTLSGRHPWLAIGALGVAAFTLLFGLELVTEDEPLQALDVAADALQIALLVATAVGAGVLAVRMREQHQERLDLLGILGEARADGERWRREAHALVAGLGAAIDRQFQTWGLSTAEREIGLLMLKGFSHKEIAALRGTSDATVRQQAKTIYQKANLPGRTAFSAFFLEDLLPPNGVRGSVPDAVSPATTTPPGASDV